MVVIVVVGLSCLSCGRRSCTYFSSTKREGEREREVHIESGYPAPPLPATCNSPLMLPLVSHFHSPSTQSLDHGGIFSHLMTSVVIHSFWTAPPFHGLRRGQAPPRLSFPCLFAGLKHKEPQKQQPTPGSKNCQSSFPVPTVGEGRGSSSFSAARPHIHLVCFFREALFFCFSVPGLCRPRCASLAPGRSLPSPQSCYCLKSFDHTEAQGFLRSSAQGSSRVSPCLLCHRAQTRGTQESFPSFRASLQ